MHVRATPLVCRFFDAKLNKFTRLAYFNASELVKGNLTDILCTIFNADYELIDYRKSLCIFSLFLMISSQLTITLLIGYLNRS